MTIQQAIKTIETGPLTRAQVKAVRQALRVAPKRKKELCVRGHALTGPDAVLMRKRVGGKMYSVCAICHRVREQASAKRRKEKLRLLATTEPCRCGHGKGVHEDGECYARNRYHVLICECVKFEAATR